ncbi:hypothetical protein C8R44DRAFT_754678 [Mycena epipterygia]|nr:hypothetical protein C8R44DRAFT_754678 [Mycena epipterygia]
MAFRNINFGPGFFDMVGPTQSLSGAPEGRNEPPIVSPNIIHTNADFQELPPSDAEEDEEEDDNEKERKTDLTRLYKLYKAGHNVTEVGENGCWKFHCNPCNHPIATSIPKRIPLDSSSQFSSLDAHQRGRKCMYSSKFVRGTSALPTLQNTPETPAPESMDVDEDQLDFQHRHSSSALPEDMPNRPLTTQEHYVSSTHIPPSIPPLITVTSDTSTFTNSGPCPGVVVNWNIEAGSVRWTFPWHQVIQKGAGDAQTDSNEVIHGFLKECMGTTMTKLPCAKCTKIPWRLLELEDLATNTRPHTNYHYLNYQQIMQLLTDKDSELRRWCLKCTNLARKLLLHPLLISFLSPHCIHQNASRPIGANSFPEVPNFLYPLWTYVDSSLHPFAWMKLFLNTKPEGSTHQCNFFKADNHICHFFVDDDTEDEKASYMLWLTPESAHEYHPLRALPEHNHAPNNLARPTTPAIQPLSMKPERWLHGIFDIHPSQHVTSPKPGIPTHRLLEPYDDLPGCLMCTYQELRFFGTKIGEALCALNLTLGITGQALNAIIQDTALRQACRCHFSVSGFNDHISSGQCGNCAIPQAGKFLHLLDSLKV